MDLVNGVIAMKQAETMSRVQYAVARKIMDTQKQQGAAVVQLINAANVGTQQAGDALVAQATGLGSQLDMYA
jgi:hypothetical protein